MHCGDLVAQDLRFVGAGCGALHARARRRPFRMRRGAATMVITEAAGSGGTMDPAVSTAAHGGSRSVEALEKANPAVATIGQILCVLVPVAVWFAPLGLAPNTQHGLAIVCFMVIAWITQAMEYALAGFIGCYLFWALGV